MKWISIALTVLLLVGVAEAAGPGLYSTTSNGLISFGGGTTTTPRQNSSIYMTSDGDIYVAWDKQSSNNGVLVGAWVNYGATFAEFSPVAFNVQSGFLMTGRGDSAFFVPSYSDSTIPITIWKWVNGSAASPAADTLSLDADPWASSGNSRPGIAWYSNNRILELRNHEKSTTDGSEIWITDAGYGSVSTSSSRGTQASTLNAGFRWPVSIANTVAGVLIHDVNGAAGAGADIRFADTTGISLVASNITGGLDFQLTGRDGYGFTGLVSYGDSNFVHGYQSPTNGQNQLNVRAGHVSSGATGSPTSVSWHASAATIISSGGVPDSFSTDITFSYLRRDPDSIWGHFRMKGTSGDYVIIRIFTPDGGANWTGYDTVLVDTTTGNTWRFWNLQAAQYANVDDTCIWFAMKFTDSLTSTSEYGKIFIDTIRLAGGGGGGGGTPTKRGTGILIGSIDDQSTGETLPGRIGEYTQAINLKREECEQ